MSITLCCQYLELNHKYEYINSLKEKTVQLKTYKSGNIHEENIIKIWYNNILNVKNFLPRLKNEGYSSFRLSSSLFPLWEFFPNARDNTSIKCILSDIGSFIQQNNIRLSVHPDQFVVLSSDSEQVIQNSIKILTEHAWIFDQMNLPKTPYYAINIHGGKRNALEKLIQTIKILPDNVRNRLTLENDELSYNVLDLNQVYQETGTPICFDSHHHIFNDANLSVENGLDIAMRTWNNIRPQTHLSNSSPGTENSSFQQRRKHSDYVSYIPEYQKILNNSNKIDIDFEFKMKNVAIKKACQEFGILL